MKKMLLLSWLSLGGLVARGGYAQTYQPKGDYAFVTTKHNFHFVGDD
jgi:hypothetical protein